MVRPRTVRLARPSASNSRASSGATLPVLVLPLPGTAFHWPFTDVSLAFRCSAITILRCVDGCPPPEERGHYKTSGMYIFLDQFSS